MELCSPSFARRSLRRLVFRGPSARRDSFSPPSTFPPPFSSKPGCLDSHFDPMEPLSTGKYNLPFLFSRIAEAEVTQGPFLGSSLHVDRRGDLTRHIPALCDSVLFATVRYKRWIIGFDGSFSPCWFQSCKRRRSTRMGSRYAFHIPAHPPPLPGLNCRMMYRGRPSVRKRELLDTLSLAGLPHHPRNLALFSHARPTVRLSFVSIMPYAVTK